MLNIHYEACGDTLEQGIREIRDLGCRAAVTINPDTPVQKIFDVVHLVDMVLIMSVFPGFGGQKFIEDTYERITSLKKHIKAEGLSTLIEVDGGVNLNNAGKLYDIGADVLVVGSFVFRSEDPIATIRSIRDKSPAGR
jgi:ribulose-phosphate 3-epimerase